MTDSTRSDSKSERDGGRYSVTLKELNHMTKENGCLFTFAIGLVITLLGVAAQFYYQKRVDDEKAIPSLKVESIEADNDSVDILTKSYSSRLFIVHEGLYRVTKIIKEAPPKYTPRHPEPVLPDNRTRRQKHRDDKQDKWRQKNIRKHNGTAPMATGPIEPYELDIVPTAPIELGKWFRLPNFKPRQIGAYDPEIITISIVDREHAGARYEIEVTFRYGDKSDPKLLTPGVFQLDVVAE